MGELPNGNDLPKDDGLSRPSNGLAGLSAPTALITVILEPQNVTQRVPLAAWATVQDLKDAIYEKFPGKPSQNGQRLVCNGKFLRDADVVRDVVKVRNAKGRNVRTLGC